MTTAAVVFAFMVWVLVGLVIGLIVALAVHRLPGRHGFELLGGGAGGATIALLIHSARERTQPRHRTRASADRRRPG
jgi:hypothetical protein